MKKSLYFAFFSIFAFFGGVNSETISMNWLNADGTLSQTTTCEAGGDIILPTAPTKRGYTFMGWALYIPIEYIESTGTQYIDTGFRPQNMSLYRMVITTSYATDGQGWRVHGGFGNGNVYVGINSESVAYYSTGIRDEQTEYRVVLGHKITQDIDCLNRTYTVTDLVNNYIEKVSVVTTQQSQRANTLLFGYSPNNLFSGKLYDAKLYYDGLLVRDMIPVLDKDDIPCMYDKVSGQYFYNAGTGQFIAGPVIGSD